MGNLINDEEVEPGEGILHHEEGIDLMPGNIELSGLEVSLVNVMSRETVLRSYIEIVRENYDYILIDCMPSLGMITIKALIPHTQRKNTLYKFLNWVSKSLLKH